MYLLLLVPQLEYWPSILIRRKKLEICQLLHGQYVQTEEGIEH